MTLLDHFLKFYRAACNLRDKVIADPHKYEWPLEEIERDMDLIWNEMIKRIPMSHLIEVEKIKNRNLKF